MVAAEKGNGIYSLSQISFPGNVLWGMKWGRESNLRYLVDILMSFGYSAFEEFLHVPGNVLRTLPQWNTISFFENIPFVSLWEHSRNKIQLLSSIIDTLKGRRCPRLSLAD